MSFTSEIKSEIIKKEIPKERRRAFLSGYVKSSGAIIYENDEYGFQVSSTVEGVSDFVYKMIKAEYGVEAKRVIENDSLNKKQREVLEVLGKDGFNILTDLAIYKGGEPNYALTEINSSSTGNKKEFIKGVFLGSGSCTLPTSGNKSYHLEFSFTLKEPAEAFKNLLSEQGIEMKSAVRKEGLIVYLKNKEKIADFFAFLGLSVSALKVYDLIINKNISNKANRQSNCDMANLKKQINASDRCVEAINKIIEKNAFDFLSKDLKNTAELRLNYPDDTLEELSEKLNVSKSGLNHRLKRLIEISKNL